MILETSEASAKAGPGVLLGGEHLTHSRFDLFAQRIVRRFNVSPAYAGAVSALLLGGRCDD